MTICRGPFIPDKTNFQKQHDRIPRPHRLTQKLSKEKKNRISMKLKIIRKEFPESWIWENLNKYR